MDLIVCQLHGPGSILGRGESISREFSLADHTPPATPEPAWQKMA